MVNYVNIENFLCYLSQTKLLSLQTPLIIKLKILRKICKSSTLSKRSYFCKLTLIVKVGVCFQTIHSLLNDFMDELVLSLCK